MIPNYQPIPLPAPLWLLQALLFIGFLTHVIPINVIMTGGLVGAWSWWQHNGEPDAYSTRYANTLTAHLPVFLSVAITQGIVPLLFLQLLYGPYYYTSSVQMGWLWIAIIPLLLVAYYGLYGFKLNKAKTKTTPWVLVGSTVIFWVIGYFFVNNLTLMMQPELWANTPTTDGLRLNTVDPQVLPRFLHFLFASFAVNGLLMGVYGLYWHKKDQGYGQWLIKTGAGLFTGITLLQLGIGSWFLISLPHNIMLNYMGQDPLATGLFVGSLILTVIGIIAGGLAWKNGSNKAMVASIATGGLVIVLMSGMRALLRLFFLKPYTVQPDTLAIQPQWDLLITFVLLAVGLIVFLVWLIGVAWKAYNPASEPVIDSNLVTPHD